MGEKDQEDLYRHFKELFDSGTLSDEEKKTLACQILEILQKNQED